jgi:glycine/D-amino acid oxidase-like deaminating enzyme
MTAKTNPESSLWLNTAVEAPVTSVLEGSISADVAIVGAGITGLSTAIHLAEQGSRVVVIDAEDIGWGASGRNGGQVIPGLKHLPRKLETLFGAEQGGRIASASQSSADYTFDLIERYGLNCDAVRQGWVKACHDPAALAQAQADAEDMSSRGAPIELLDKSQIERVVGSRLFIGGFIDKRAGSVQPMSYTRELCRVAQSLGVEVYTRTRVLELEQKVQAGRNVWLLDTANGQVKADSVVLATNGHTDKLWPKLRKTVFPMSSFQIATQPLPKELQEEILPGGQVVSDSHRMLNYFRKDAHGRLLLGGEGGFKDNPSFKDAVNIQAAIDKTFPKTKSVKAEFVWSGQVAVTDDYLPRLNNPAPNLYAAIGFNGRGVAMATLMGKYLSQLLTGTNQQDIPFPITGIKPVPFHSFYKIGASVVMNVMRMQDKLEDRRMAKRSKTMHS